MMKPIEGLILIGIGISFAISTPAYSCIYHSNGHSAETLHNSQLTAWMTNNEPKTDTTQMSTVSSKKIARHTISGQLSTNQSKRDKNTKNSIEQ